MTNPASSRVAARARAPREARRARRALRTVLLAGAAATALAAPAVASAAANPMTFDYSNSTAVTSYARPTGAVVVGRNFLNPALVDQIQNGGGEVYQYVNVIDSWWTGMTATGEQAALYGGSKTDPSYLMYPLRSNWPGTYLMDMRPGSPWILHAVENIKQWFPTTHAKGIFLDVVGTRLWTPAWNAMSATERADWTAGNADFVHRLRVALGPNVILVANNTWPSGNAELNGITVEHHSFSEAGFWGGITGRSDWFKPVRNMIIANGTSDAYSWAGVAGVTHVTPQSTYEQPVAPLLSFSPLPGTGSSTTTSPTPTTDPAPAPAPTTDPAPAPAPPPSSSTAIMAGNLLGNPSFESSTTPWSSWHGSLGSVAVTGAPDGLRAALVKLGTGTSYTIGDFPGRVTVPAAGKKYVANAYVKAANSGTVGKPVGFYLRERNSAGTTVQQVHGTIRKLSTGWQTVSATMTAKYKGDRIDVFVAQANAVGGNAMLVDAISMAPAS